MIKYGGATTSKGRFVGRAEQVIDVSVRRSGEEDGTYETHRTHGTVADGTKGHKRQRDTLTVLHMQSCTLAVLYTSQMRWLFVGEA